MAGKLVKDWVVDRWVNLDLFHRQQAPQATGCIQWTGVVNNIGYPFIGFNYPQGKASPSGHRGGMMLATRLALMIKLGRAIAPGMNANHTCHNKLCVNPAHLTEGTQREKLDAMRVAGITGGWPAGVARGSYDHQQHNRLYKYTIDDIQWIRTADSDAIAARYSLTKQRASSMRHGFRLGYKWLPCPPLTTQQRRGRKPKAK